MRTLFFFLALQPLAAQSGGAATGRAIAYLLEEVPRWKLENHCYSCHNNGDAARALFLAGVRKGPAIDDTLGYLRTPLKWTEDVSPLAMIQFANALAASGESGEALGQALDRVAAAQSADGHWETDDPASIGSPVTYGHVLGTVLARALLKRDPARHRLAIEKAERWLRARPVTHPSHLAARVMAFEDPADIARLAGLQAKDGGWNGGEAYDTALAVIALAKAAPEAAGRGRAYLRKIQLEPGGWPGSTRPAGGPSYAQHISTTAWALLALLTARAGN